MRRKGLVDLYRDLRGQSQPLLTGQVDSVTIRDASPRDLASLTELHVRTYNQSHMPLGVGGPTFATREPQWREKLNSLDATRFCLVVETPAGELVGFAFVHPAANNPGFETRLSKIYLLRSHQRQGLGHRLVKEVTRRLLENGITSMMLFTETSNEAACRFYDSLGGERLLDDSGAFGGQYGWRNLRTLGELLAKE